MWELIFQKDSNPIIEFCLQIAFQYFNYLLETVQSVAPENVLCYKIFIVWLIKLI